MRLFLIKMQVDDCRPMNNPILIAFYEGQFDIIYSNKSVNVAGR